MSCPTVHAPSRYETCLGDGLGRRVVFYFDASAFDGVPVDQSYMQGFEEILTPPCGPADPPRAARPPRPRRRHDDRLVSTALPSDSSETAMHCCHAEHKTPREGDTPRGCFGVKAS